MESEHKSQHKGSPLISKSAASGFIQAGITELIEDYDFVPGTVNDSEMQCGGRANLNQHLEAKRLGRERARVPLPCGSCAVKNACLIGSAR